MSSASIVPADVWTVRARQLGQVARLELRRSLALWRLLSILFLAFLPTFLLAGHAYQERHCELTDETLIFTGIMHIYYVRAGIFFGCLGVFLRLLSGEVAERTLHYLFLAPVRREVVMVGKFLAASLLTSVVYGLAVAVSFGLLFGHTPAGREFLRHGPGLGHLGSYLLITVLACVGYGAVFLGLSLVFRNPVVAAVVVFVWEGINGVLPVWLKQVSVTYYLKPLFPFELPLEGFFALFTVVAEPVTPWVAVGGVLAVALGALGFAAWRIRTLEVSYTVD